ncbi:hypothetical protein ACFFMP_17450 [Pseudoroseomonas cervicalis]
MFSASAPFRDAYAATTYRFGGVGLRIGRRAGWTGCSAGCAAAAPPC